MTHGDRSQGIDIHKALEILSLRQQHDHQDDCHSHPPPSVSAGQTLHIFDSEKEEEVQKDAAMIQEERIERAKRLEQELSGMMTAELLHALLRAQEDRVVTYKTYNSALNDMLTSHNMTHYPQACAAATASFAVLSDTIRKIRERLPSNLQTHVTELQQHEQSKLQQTAAWHLERLRAASGDESQAQILLEQGCQRLAHEIQRTEEHINNVLDELRCALADTES